MASLNKPQALAHAAKLEEQIAGAASTLVSLARVYSRDATGRSPFGHLRYRYLGKRDAYMLAACTVMNRPSTRRRILAAAA